MTNPRTVLMQASQGPVPENWRVFTKKRGKISGFLRGTSDDPDPLLVITPDGVIEYKDERKPLTIVNFHDLVPHQTTFALLTEPEDSSTRAPRQELSVANAMLTPTTPLPMIIQGFR